tara:strand:- start:38 stop:523 length:486 start_codon:yes stop_codon:yes gene_type:complete
MKYWEILLREQRERGKSGLTIPFIIGSQRYLPAETMKEQTISDLIVEISKNDSFETNLRYCMDVQTLILEMRKAKNAVFFPKYKNVAQKNLSVALSFDNLGNSLEEIIPELESKFQEPIEKGLFSAKPNADGRTVVWKEYAEDEDIPFIKNAFQKLKDRNL